MICCQKPKFSKIQFYYKKQLSQKSNDDFNFSPSPNPCVGLSEWIIYAEMNNLVPFQRHNHRSK